MSLKATERVTNTQTKKQAILSESLPLKLHKYLFITHECTPELVKQTHPSGALSQQEVL